MESNTVKWVLVDNSQGATTQDGSTLSTAVLELIAEAVTAQINNEFAEVWGGAAEMRVAAGPNDIRPDEWAYVFLASLPDAPGASAYHDINGKGVPFALCAVPTCHSLYGPNGISVDVSHECLETAGDRYANQYDFDDQRTLHAHEMCDAVEVQTYGKTCANGAVVQVSNWLLRSWFDPRGVGPYDYMSATGKPGAVAPGGPLQTAKGRNGNYQLVSPWGGASQKFAVLDTGTRRKGRVPHWSSRAGRRLEQLQKNS